MISTTCFSKPASSTVVSPAAKQLACAANNADCISSLLAGGITLATKSTALSTKIPVGLLFLTSINPPFNFVFSLIPALLSASEFTNAAWPSTRFKKTGVVGKRESNFSFVGKSFTIQSF